MSRVTAKKSEQINPLGWMVTFSDMMTLLLTFFVMIISITSQDPKSLSIVDSFGEFQGVTLSNGVLLFSDRSRLLPVVELVENMDNLPEEVLFDQEEIKSAIFQLDPDKEIDYQQLEITVKEAVDIFKDERGLVIKWDQNALFTEGSTILLPESLTLLQKMGAFLINVSLPISIESHTNPLSELEGGHSQGAYELAMARSKVVMQYLVGLNLPEKRFRIGGYGGSRPLTEDPDQAAENSRLEIVIYKPGPSSWAR